jgi:hypothetical protein
MQFDRLKRREFITLIGGTAAAWPLAAQAQQAAKVHRIGFLSAGAEVQPSKLWSIFVSELRELGWIEGKNIEFHRRYADNRLDRLPELTTELVCQSAFKFDPVSASNFDPFERRGLAVALASSELAGIAETWRARVV